MTRPSLTLIAAAASLAIAGTAEAQHHGHHMPGMKMPAPAKKPVAKKPAAEKTVAKKPAAKKPAVKKAAPAKKVPSKPVRKPAPAKPAAVADPHAGHDMSQMPAEATPVADPHAGHDMSQMPAKITPVSDPHAGHDMSTMTADAAPPAGTDLPAGDAPPPPIPSDHAADAVYGAQAMHMGRHHLATMHGAQKFSKLMLNTAEYQVRNGRDGFEWDGAGWYGGDIDRLWIKSEGEGEVGRGLERAEVQALYSRAVGPYFNLQGGIRYDFKPNPSRVYAVAAVEGLAPSFFDVEGSLFVSNKGEVLARVEGHYDQRITQRLILQPRAELNFAAQNTRELGIGAGLSDAEAGLRLRYDIRREFAPYVGVQYRRAFGRTRDYLRDEGEDAGGASLLAGVRLWF